jgi:hypothetical protein
VSVFTEHHVIKRRVIDSALRRAPVRYKPRKCLIVARPVEQGPRKDHVRDTAVIVRGLMRTPIEEVNPRLVPGDQVPNPVSKSTPIPSLWNTTSQSSSGLVLMVEAMPSIRVRPFCLNALLPPPVCQQWTVRFL